MTELDVAAVRAHFPAFAHPETGRWAHLENAGGSYVPRHVIDLLTTFFVATKVQPYWAFGPSVAAGEAMDRAVALVPHLLDADPGEVHLGPSTSQNTYVLAHALRAELAEGDEVVVTDQDHEANIGPWRRLAATGIVVKEWSVDRATGLLDVADLEPLLTDRTRLVCVTHCSNIAATVNPVADIARLAHAAGARVVVDGVSWAPHAAVDVKALDVDFYLFSTYKTYGPHLGVLYTRADHLERIANQGHVFNAHKPTARLTPAGPQHAEIAAAAGIVDYYDDLYRHHAVPAGWPDDATPVARIRAVFDLVAPHEERLMAPLLEVLASKPGVHVVGRPEPDRAVRAPTVAFWSTRRSSASIYRALVEAGVSCGHGFFYAYRLVQALGLDPADGVVRLSMVHYNTLDEVQRAVDVLDRVL